MNRKGFTLMEMLLGLMLSSFVINLLVLSFKTLSFNTQQHLISDVNARIQLSRTLQYYQDIVVDNHCIELKNSLIGKEDQQIIFKNNKIYVTPGVNILISDVKTVQFNRINDSLTLTYNKGGQIYQYEKKLR